MLDHLPPTSYISRVVPVAPGVAGSVFATTTTPAARVRRLPRRFLSHPIEIALTPWSASKSELSLRFYGRRHPSWRDCERAGELLDALAADLELRCLLALHPSHTTGQPARREVALSAGL